jgi:hypothetical protein
MLPLNVRSGAASAARIPDELAALWMVPLSVPVMVPPPEIDPPAVPATVPRLVMPATIPVMVPFLTWFGPEGFDPEPHAVSNAAAMTGRLRLKLEG